MPSQRNTRSSPNRRKSSRGKRTPPRRSPTPRTGLDKDGQRAIKRVMQMMAIAGKSGREGQIVRYISQQLRRSGAPETWIRTDQVHRKTLLVGETGNLIFKLPGTVRGPRRLFVAHIDTVPICVGSLPVLKGLRVRSADSSTGLGADNRAGAAVLLNTALYLLRNKIPHPPLTFLWPVQEEIGLQGARYVRLSWLGKPRLAFNFDGGAPGKLTVGATGGYRMRIRVEGLASHAGNVPEMGVSAIAIAALAISELVQTGWHGQIVKGSSAGTSNVGLIRGGTATNVVTDCVELSAEARSHDPSFRRRIVEAFEAAFRRAAKSVRNTQRTCGHVHFNGQLDYESFLLSPDEMCIREAERVVRGEGLEPLQAVANGGLDANWLTGRGIPTVSLGCGQRNIHSVREELDVTEFLQACRIAMNLATSTE